VARSLHCRYNRVSKLQITPWIHFAARKRVIWSALRGNERVLIATAEPIRFRDPSVFSWGIHR